MPIAASNPLTDPPPKEVHLPKAPLEWVIAMARFPMVMEIERPEFLAEFQKVLKPRYAVGQLETVQDRVLGGAAPLPKKVWRFFDEKRWRVSLAQDFVAVETRSYTSRDELIARLREALEAMPAAGRPARIDQLGVRYIDRIRGEELRDIARLVRPEIAGVASTPAMAGCMHAFSDNAFRVGNDVLVARWGLLPARATLDPAVMDAIDEPSWLLDLDMVSQQPLAFDSAALGDRALAFATRIYTVFRWAVTPEFLIRYGGKT
jgi:uncharacterized protein (TIGR04255 family)